MPKRSLSPHQKQIRFFTGFSIFAVVVVTFFLFWMANRGHAAH